MSKIMGKSALGKGLGALMGDFTEGSSEISSRSAESNENQGIMNLSVEKLRGNPNQPRRVFDADALQELSQSIKENGIIQPILVEKDEDGFVIVAGERRFRAAKLAGLTEVPVIVRSFSEQERLEIALIENIQREDLNPMEEARAYRHLMETFNLSQEEVAKKVGKQRSTVANALRLIKLPDDMQEAVEGRILSPGHARAVLSINQPQLQRQLFSRIVDQGLSVRESEAMATQMNGSNETAEGIKKDVGAVKKTPEIEQIEQKFREALGTKISLKGNGKKGSLEISYYSTDDLSRLFELISAGKSLFDE